jgi:uncharacterized protein YoxC
MELPTASWTNLALQIPLALVIVVLMVYVLRHLEKVDKENRETIHKVTTDMLTFMTQQAELNREFLRFQQDTHNQGIARIAEAVKSDKVDTIREVSALTTKVDSMIQRIFDRERRPR